MAFNTWVAALKSVSLTIEEVEVRRGLKLIRFSRAHDWLVPGRGYGEGCVV